MVIIMMLALLLMLLLMSILMLLLLLEMLLLEMLLLEMLLPLVNLCTIMILARVVNTRHPTLHDHRLFVHLRYFLHFTTGD